MGALTKLLTFGLSTHTRPSVYAFCTFCLFVTWRTWLRVPGPPPFLRATLKKWEWPGDEAMVCVVVSKIVGHQLKHWLQPSKNYLFDCNGLKTSTVGMLGRCSGLMYPTLLQSSCGYQPSMSACWWFVHVVCGYVVWYKYHTYETPFRPTTFTYCSEVGKGRRAKRLIHYQWASIPYILCWEEHCWSAFYNVYSSRQLIKLCVCKLPIVYIHVHVKYTRIFNTILGIHILHTLHTPHFSHSGLVLK